MKVAGLKSEKQISTLATDLWLSVFVWSSDSTFHYGPLAPWSLVCLTFDPWPWLTPPHPPRKWPYTDPPTESSELPKLKMVVISVGERSRGAAVGGCVGLFKIGYYMIMGIWTKRWGALGRAGSRRWELRERSTGGPHLINEGESAPICSTCSSASR